MSDSDDKKYAAAIRRSGYIELADRLDRLITERDGLVSKLQRVRSVTRWSWLSLPHETMVKDSGGAFVRWHELDAITNEGTKP